MKYILCFLYLIIQSNTCLAVSTGASQALKKQAELFFHNYVDHLNLYLSGQDTMAVKDKTSQDIRLPSLVIPPSGKLTEFKESEQVIKGFTGFLEQIKSNNVHSIKWQNLDINVINDFAAIGSNTAIFLDPQGKTLQTVKAVYVLHRDENNWAIALRIPQTH